MDLGTTLKLRLHLKIHSVASQNLSEIFSETVSVIRCVLSILRISCLCCLFTLLCQPLLINDEVLLNEKKHFIPFFLLERRFFSLFLICCKLFPFVFHTGLRPQLVSRTYPSASSRCHDDRITWCMEVVRKPLRISTLSDGFCSSSMHIVPFIADFWGGWHAYVVWGEGREVVQRIHSIPGFWLFSDCGNHRAELLLSSDAGAPDLLSKFRCLTASF